MRLRNRAGWTWAVGAAVLGCLSSSCAPDKPAAPAASPAALRVSASPDVQVEPASLEFGLFEVGETASLLATIRNRGRAELTIREIQPPDPFQPFTLDDAPRAPLVLAPGARVDLIVTYNVELVGSFVAAVRIVSDDPDEPTVDLPVSGTAATNAVAIGEPPSPCDDRIPDGAIVGTAGDDVLFGTPGDDIIVGLDGDDVIHGLEGNDVLCGGPGRDRLIGGPGDDRIDGGSGNDGGSHPTGARGLFGGPGADILWGGDGHDVLVADSEAQRVRVGSPDRLFGGPGNDCLFGGSGADVLAGGTGDDRLDGGAANDVLAGDEGNDRLRGGLGNDLLAGGPGDDFLFGEDGSDELHGGPGIDVLEGGDGDDVLKGGDGADFLFGGPGDDMLFGGDGQDVVEGGAGDDFIDTGLLGAIWPGFDREPDDTVVGESFDIDYTPLDFANVPCGG